MHENVNLNIEQVEFLVKDLYENESKMDAAEVVKEKMVEATKDSGERVLNQADTLTSKTFHTFSVNVRIGP